MGSPIYHIEIDRSTGKVCSIHLGDSSLLGYRQSVTDREVIPLIDLALVEAMRRSPENYAVRNNQIVLLPENERICARLHVMDQVQHENPFDFIAKRQKELNDLITVQTDKIDEAIRINSRVALAAEDLTPEVNQLRTTLEMAANQFGDSTKVLDASTRSNSEAAKTVSDQNAAILEQLRGLRGDIQSLTAALRKQ